MVGSRQTGEVAHADGDVVARADFGQPRVKALSPEQGTEQQRHALAVAIAFAQHLGGTVGTMARHTGLVSHIADVALHPAVDGAELLLRRLAAFRDGAEKLALAGQRAVNLLHAARPAVEGVDIGKGPHDNEMGLHGTQGRLIVIVGQGWQTVNGKREHRV